jgi:hypothetical protein
MSPKWKPFWDLCPPFGQLGAHLDTLWGKKSVPKAFVCDFVDITKTLIFYVFLYVFGAFGHLAGVLKLIDPERHFESSGVLRGHPGPALNFPLRYTSWNWLCLGTFHSESQH